jgi:1-acyl-sn-glycerol-3-phosphate acyltransferase
VVVSNHESIADIPVLSHLPWEMKWLSKASNFHVPALGWMMKMAGDIPLERGNRESGQHALDRCRWYLDRGMSVMIFPEGTRSKNGTLGAFKDGAFRLAAESGRQILPVVVSGTRDAIPKHSWVFGGKSKIKVHVLPPISPAGQGKEDIARLKTSVREQIAHKIRLFSDAIGKTGTAQKG